MLPQEQLTGQILAAAIEVHRALGPGFLESIYENALALELHASGLVVERQKIAPVIYRGTKVGEHRLDLLVQGSVIVELKAVADLDPIFFATLRSYLKALQLDTGLLLNFAATPPTVKRVGREAVASTRPRIEVQPPVPKT
jgi:GxxExxY protein